MFQLFMIFQTKSPVEVSNEAFDWWCDSDAFMILSFRSWLA